MNSNGALSLQSLREAGAASHDAVRFRYLEALSARMAQQSAPVQALLAPKLQAALEAYQAHWLASQHVEPMHAESATSEEPSLMLQLNRYVSARTQAALAQHQGEDGASNSDMKSVRRFSAVWHKVSAQQRVDQAAEHAPENAGPLNSHRLMLRSLTLMRQLSPDYLARFMSQMETLLWLDHVNQQTSLRDGKTKRATRAKK